MRHEAQILDAQRRVEGARTMIDKKETNHAFARSLSNAGLAKTRSRKDALWRVFSMQQTSHMAGTMCLLEKNGLVFFNKELYPSVWRLTDKGLEVLFAWMPELANVQIEGLARFWASPSRM